MSSQARAALNDGDFFNGASRSSQRTGPAGLQLSRNVAAWTSATSAPHFVVSDSANHGHAPGGVDQAERLSVLIDDRLKAVALYRCKRRLARLATCLCSSPIEPRGSRVRFAEPHAGVGRQAIR